MITAHTENRKHYLEQFDRVAHDREEVMPESNFSFSRTVTNSFKKLRKLLDEGDDARKKGV